MATLATTNVKQLEQHWLDRFRKGDSEAFEAVYRAYGDSVYRICYRMTGCRTEAEDLAQETFLAAFKSRQKFEGRAALSTWLYRLALDCCRSRQRKKSVTHIAMLREPASPDFSSERAETAALTDLLMRLPERLRESILLVKVEGLKYREAAEVLGVPTGTVQYWVHEAVAKIRSLTPEEVTGAGK
jgi:RNA polymerase sigma-70 factor, ECF subfamily